MNKHVATYNGRTFTRNSKTRTYTHAVIVIEDPDAYLAHNLRHANTEHDREWFRKRHERVKAEGEKYGDGLSIGVWGWSGRRDLAEKAAAAAYKVWGPAGGTVAIVETTLK